MSEYSVLPCRDVRSDVPASSLTGEEGNSLTARIPRCLEGDDLIRAVEIGSEAEACCRGNCLRGDGGESGCGGNCIAGEDETSRLALGSPSSYSEREIRQQNNHD